MSRTIRFQHVLHTALLATFACAAQSAEFVYQGRLEDRGAPANGRYDLRIAAFGGEKSAPGLMAPIEFPGVEVKDGSFELRFDALLAQDRDAWLEVAVRDAGSAAFASIPGRSKAISAPLIGTCWSSTGDSGSNPATNFLGTTDVQSLVLRTGNAPSLRIEPASILTGGLPITASVVAGSHLNEATVGVRGAVISGGGVQGGSDPDWALLPNLVSDHYGTVGGGAGNTAGDAAGTLKDGALATVGGGVENRARGYLSTVGGGSSNIAAGTASWIGGGDGNSASGLYSGIGGGYQNTASGERSTVAGGFRNFAIGDRASVGGGWWNLASGESSSIAGGYENTGSGYRSAIAGGFANIAGGDYSAVGGGTWNAAVGEYAVVPGGRMNCAGGAYAWAAGYRAKVRPASDPGPGSACGSLTYPGGEGDAGTFVWSDSANADFVSTGPDQFLVRAVGGVALNTNTLAAGTDLAVAWRSAGANVDVLLRPTGAAWGINLGASGDATSAGLYIARSNGSSFVDYALWQADGRLRVFFDNPIKPTAGGWAAPSDERLKQDITPLAGALDRLLALQGVAFAYRADAPQGYHVPGRHLGFVAQAVETVFPDWVSYDQAGYRLVAPKGFEALTVEALRELRTERDAALTRLEADNIDLRGQLIALRDQQSTEIATLRIQLADLRALLAPAVADGGR